MNKKIIHTVVEHTATLYPDNTAVEYLDQVLTYQQLNGQANQVAHALLGRNIQSGDIVGLFLPASPAYVSSLLGVLKAGAVFLPLDVAAPQKRQDYILDKAKPKFIITSKDHLSALPDILHDQVILLDSCETFPTSNPEVEMTPEDSNYLLFTSGSTGNPKAIVGRQKSLSHFIHWEVGEFRLDQQVRVSLLAAPTFDVSLRDIFVPLLVGGTLCIPSAEQRAEMSSLLEWLAASRINWMHCVPSIFRLLMQEIQQQDTQDVLPDLSTVLLAGEAVYGRDVLQWRKLVGERIPLVNLYGPSETTLAKMFHRVTEDYPAQVMVPIGQPISNTAALILKNNRLCNIGEIGEIYIKTPFLSQGYYQDAALTQTVFIQNPLTDQPDVIYKTGDMGRYRADRSVEFLGRQDHQVKVNGIRVELGEIEQTLMQHDALRQAVVVARRNRDESYSLIAYYTVSQPIEQNDLREYAGEFLASAMIPAFFVEMEQFQLNLHGKVDRKALPEPESLLYQNLDYVAPRTEGEKKLAKIWGEILGLKQVGVENTFIELGGDSLKAIRAVALIYKEMEVEVSLKDFFKYDSIAELDRYIANQERVSFAAIPALTAQEDYACSHAQQRLWVLQHMDVDARAYNLSGVYDMQGDCNVLALEAALHQLIDRHEILRTDFVMHDGQLCQRIAPDAQVFHLEKTQAADEDELQQLITQNQALTFNLSKAPLLRVQLVEMAADQHVLLVNIHHIICDAWSMDIMLRELFSLYQTQLKNTSADLSPLNIHYKDFAAWQNQQLASDDTDISRSWWLTHLAGELASLQLPTDRPRPAVQTFNGATEHFYFDATLTEALRQYAQQRQMSLFTLLLALVRVLLFRYTGQSDFVLGTPIAGRTHPDLENQVGLYVNTLALRDVVDKSETFTQIVERAKQTLNEAFEHQNYPFDRLLQDLNLAQDMSRNPLFDVMVMLQNVATAELALQGLEIKPHGNDRDWDSSRFDLMFHFTEENNGIVLDLNYNIDLFDRARIQRTFGHLNALATAAVDPSKQNVPITQLALLSEAEREQILLGFNVREYPLDANATIASLFARQVNRHPTQIALRLQEKTLTYAELDQQAGHLAQVLRARYQCQDEDRIAVSLDRGFNSIIAMLACVKSGLVYVPVDPEYPAERIRYLLQNSASRLLLSESSVIPGLSVDDAQVLDVDVLLNAQLDAQAEAVVIHPQQLAFVIHTSGSTGEPKGVMLDHAGFVNMILDQIRHFDMQPGDNMLQFASSSFDASLYESFIALLSGATLTLIDRATIEDTHAFTNYLQQQGVTTAVLPPVYLRALNQQPLPGLRNLMTIGEPAVVEDVRYYAGNKNYFNGYGPSEGGICAAVYKASPEGDYASGVPIGQPTANTHMYVLDEDMQLLPAGYVGELCISGISLSHGYLNQTELTEQKFIADPFIAGARMYRTGDLGYWNQDGQLMFIGRKDNQVKLAGHRIEPSEIAYQLRQHASVKDAVVLLLEQQKMLQAYVVLDAAEPSVEAAQLQHFLQQKLPGWMVPAHIHLLDAIPLTVNGKVDKKTLQAIRPAQTESAMHAPQTEQEKLLAEAWRQVLQTDAIGLNEDYFALGGDSIKAIQISAYVREQGYELKVQSLFQYPVLAQAALEMKPLVRQISQDEIIGATPLLPIQHWFFSLQNPEPHHFNQAVLLQSKQRIKPDVLRETAAALLLHHDALRSVYVTTDAGIQQTIKSMAEIEAAFSHTDLTAEADPLAAYQRNANQLNAAFNLAQGPLFKLALFNLPDEDRVLLCAHHLVVDGVSWRILLEDFANAYHQADAGKAITLASKTDSYQYFATQLADYAKSGAMQTQLAYWQQIENMQIQPVPQDMACPTQNRADAGQCSVELTAEDTERLLIQAHQAYNTRIDDLLLVALAITLQQRYGILNSRIDLEKHGRETEFAELDLSRTLGWFTAMHPFALNLLAEASNDPGKAIKSIKEAIRQIPQQGIGYGALKYLTRELDASPQTNQIGFNYLGQFDNTASDQNWRMNWDEVGEVVSEQMPQPHELDFLSMVDQGVLKISLSYHSKRYSAEHAQALLADYVSALQMLIQHCCKQQNTEMTPSDLTFSDMSQDDLDAVLDELDAALDQL